MVMTTQDAMKVIHDLRDQLETCIEMERDPVVRDRVSGAAARLGAACGQVVAHNVLLQKANLAVGDELRDLQWRVRTLRRVCAVLLVPPVCLALLLVGYAIWPS